MMMRSATAVFTLVMLASACSSARPTIDRHAARVEIFGDSIVEESDAQLAAALTHAGWLPYIDGHGGSAITGGPTIPSWPSEIQQKLKQFRPNVVVIELGTNGCSCGPDLASGIDKIMMALHGIKRVYWINVRAGAPTPANALAIDDAINNAQQRWANLHVIDMNRRFQNAPQLIAADHVHLSSTGIAVFSQMIVRALPQVVTT